MSIRIEWSPAEVNDRDDAADAKAEGRPQKKLTKDRVVISDARQPRSRFQVWSQTGASVLRTLIADKDAQAEFERLVSKLPSTGSGKKAGGKTFG